MNYLEANKFHQGLAEELIRDIEPNSVALSVWSPPYHVGKQYEDGQTFEAWQEMLRTVIEAHFDILKPGSFLAVNIGDILVFRDETMPRFQAENLTMRRSSVTREQVLAAMELHPEYNRRQLAKILGCSEQTVQRRLEGNNIRGGKYATQTRVKIVGGLIEQFALDAGLYTYDRRIWVKDAAWANSHWTTNSYRSVDEFEYIYVFWKPGITTVDRKRMTPEEWTEWGSRGIWSFPSVRRNDVHEAMFPVELPARLIKMLTDEGDVVLDCFMGSGSTAIAATTLNRNFIGIEKDPKYVKLSQERLLNVPPQLNIRY
ncbi:DNA-methyltransferase [Schaalia sp. lx-100]|uniref:DNA-methyltransferase n=1 Tax=Schaalia sp. lx-100 TaxID=2899081 RepID=UPI001E3D7FA9|nr:site-specific DNA-methyltransferase [Schaalia sp. lx-100]MCD4557012.1 site-specific DNA-methyltransferase [Schaalia sp. lx-100]